MHIYFIPVVATEGVEYVHFERVVLSPHFEVD